MIQALIMVFVFIKIATTYDEFLGEKYEYVEKLRNNDKISEDGRLDFMGLADKYGHPANVHYVITEDGYNLTLFHIPGRRKHPVLLVHGNGVDGDCFIVRGNTSLAITLAENNYDVWVANMRGTMYSQRHLSIDPADKRKDFFNYTFYDMGIYDVPATIDYILKKTEEKQLMVIGYSLGTTTLFVMGAEKPEYNDKVSVFIALAPFCYTRYQQGSANSENFAYIANNFLSMLGIWELQGRNQYATHEIQAFCLDQDNYDKCVKGYVFGMFGPDEANFEPDFMPTFFGHFPAGTSTKNLFHISQVHIRDEFAQFDLGPVENRRVYNSSKPPKFDLTKVTMKVALFVGKADYLSTERDVQRLADQLPNVVHHQVLPYENFNHYDFVYAKNMPDILYPYLMKVVKKYD